jgi:AraC family transcriptional regulator of adaptative response/methylated-DNA-[protein]-cysteine methyltransferase
MPPAAAHRTVPGTTFRPSLAAGRSHAVPGVRHARFPSPLGTVLLAASSHGICFVALGHHRQALERELCEAFPESAPAESPAPLDVWAAEIVRLLAGAKPTMDLPLDPLGTPFQRLVWAELRRIPRGTTRSYREIAGRIGRPTAARAVAQACAHNPVAVLIPCHRVVRGDGALGGYRWGVDRKQVLLDAERASGETSRRRNS